VVLQVRNETAWVLDIVRDRLEYPDLKRKVVEVYRNWRNACDRCELLIENKGSGMSLIQVPAQPVDATQALNLSAGVSNCKVSRGRSLS